MGYIALMLALCVGVLVITLYFQSRWLDQERRAYQSLLRAYIKLREAVGEEMLRELLK
jgi:hypothetical protein